MIHENTNVPKWRVRLFIAAAIIFGIYFGFMFGISLVSPWLGIDLGPGYENAEVHYFHSVQWGVYWGILICGSLLCLAWKPLKKPIVMEFIIIVSGLYIVAALSFGHGILRFDGCADSDCHCELSGIGKSFFVKSNLLKADSRSNQYCGYRHVFRCVGYFFLGGYTA